ncbi:MAG: hypothetical protein IJH91_06370 [Mogibacterium sp.]|nr:hypothetical protein [Mogibacterium sp.]
MFWILLKKQASEVFKGYFYDAKKNRMRSVPAIIAWFVFFIVIMVVFLGGMFTTLALSLCAGLVSVGVGWLYFLLMSGLAVVLGAFGSIFNSYTSLYLSKDNDLLLSLPIPVRTIIAARIVNVYLLGAMYSAVVLLPTLIVYWGLFGATARTVICGILLFLIVTGFVMVLACLLGWVVAKLSRRLKNKSYITVLLTLLFIGVYYFCYFKANAFIRELILHAEIYGAKVKGKAYAFYLFGRIGEGDWVATAIYFVVMVVLLAAVWTVLTRSFLSIAVAGGTTTKVRYVEKTVKRKSEFGALLSKEFTRFTSNANYMLNSGLGILMIPALGVLLLLKGRELCAVINDAFTGRPDSGAILICTMLFMLASMTDTAAPSISLEGKSLWIPQSLPVTAKTVLRSKLSMQLILLMIPMTFTVICAAVAVPGMVAVKLLVCCIILVFAVFYSVWCMVIGVRMPVLHWTNETAPIKQSGGVMLALFGDWGLAIVFVILYLAVGYKLGAVAYLALWTVVFAAIALLLLRWLDTRGAKAFEAL